MLFFVTQDTEDKEKYKKVIYQIYRIMSVLRYSKTLSDYYYFVVPVLSEQTVFNQDGSKSLSQKSKSDIDIKTKFISLLLCLSCMGLLIHFILFFFLGSVYYQRMLSWNRSNHKKMVDFRGSGKESKGKMKKWDITVIWLRICLLRISKSSQLKLVAHVGVLDLY